MASIPNDVAADTSAVLAPQVEVTVEDIPVAESGRVDVQTQPKPNSQLIQLI